MNVGAAMHRGVIGCPSDFCATTVARIMAAHRIHSVVVEVDGRAPRIVTDLDVASALSEGDLATRTAAEIARPCPIVKRDDTLAHAVALMHEWRTTHAVVTNSRSERVVGVLSVLDIVNAMEGELESVDRRSRIGAPPDGAVASPAET